MITRSETSTNQSGSAMNRPGSAAQSGSEMNRSGSLRTHLLSVAMPSHLGQVVYIDFELALVLNLFSKVLQLPDIEGNFQSQQDHTRSAAPLPTSREESSCHSAGLKLMIMHLWRARTHRRSIMLQGWEPDWATVQTRAGQL